MTARQAIPSVRAQKLRSTEPKADFVKANTRGKNAAERGVDVARARGKSTASAASAALIDVNKPLTEKQRLFVDAWAKGDTIPNACLRAGFSDDGLGYRLARMPNILALKAQLSAKYEEVAQMSRQKVMDGLMEAIDMAKLMSEPNTMVQGWKTVGQMCGYFAPVEVKMKVDVSGTLVVDRLNSMTDAELLKLITSGTAPAIGP